MVEYADDTSGWKPWQRDYRLGVLLIVPPPAVSRVIDGLRARHDPASSAASPAHVSVSDPLAREMAPALLRELESALRAVPAFTLHVDAPRALAGRPGVSCPVRPRDRIDALKRALHATSAFRDEAYARRDIPPHMTIAEFVSLDASPGIAEAARSEFAGTSFECASLSLLVPDASFRFSERLRIPLGSGSGAPQEETPG